MDLQKYRYDGSLEWYEEECKRIGTERVKQIIDAVYKLLNELKPNCTFDIARCTKPENHRLVVMACCLYIMDGNTNYEFNETFTQIRHGMAPKKN